jgi:cation/acetate symporter
MLTGIAITFSQPIAGGIIPAVNTLFPLTASALCGAPLVIAIMIAVSRFTSPPSEKIRRFLAEEVHGEHP